MKYHEPLAIAYALTFHLSSLLFCLLLSSSLLFFFILFPSLRFPFPLFFFLSLLSLSSPLSPLLSFLFPLSLSSLLSLLFPLSPLFPLLTSPLFYFLFSSVFCFILFYFLLLFSSSLGEFGAEFVDDHDSCDWAGGKVPCSSSDCTEDCGTGRTVIIMQPEYEWSLLHVYSMWRK